MAKEKDEVLNANQGAPAADIPDLKKKEKERKKGGAAWSGSGGGAGSFTGATGGTVARAAASAAIGAAEAGEAGGIFATISEFLAGLMSTLAGKIAVGLAAFLLLAGAGALAYELLHGGASGAGVGGLNLGPVSDSMKIRSGDGDMLGVNGNGELAFGGAKPAAAPTAPATTTDKAPTDQKAAGPVPDPAQQAADAARQDVLAHNLSGAKLSTSLGGDFGGKNIFSGNNSGYAPKFNAGLSQLSGASKPGTKGNLATMTAKSPRGSIGAMDMTRARSGQAIAQLKMARGMSVVGANSSGETAASAADGAFDQQGVTGGALNTIGAPAGISDGSTSGASSGSGAPDTTSMPGATAPPSATTGSTDPGLDSTMSQIGQLAQEAGQMQKEGLELIVAGVALIAAGVALMAIWGMEAIGAALIGIGGMLVGIGVMMKQMASMMASMANSLGSAVASQVGQYQGAIVQDCTSQAIASAGSAPCNSSNSTAATSDYNSANSAALSQQSTVGTATPTLGGNGGVTTNGGSTSGTGGSSNH